MLAPHLIQDELGNFAVHLAALGAHIDCVILREYRTAGQKADSFYDIVASYASSKDA
jgi:hypothetical protein